jgi:tol-pal system-associated acyl-CoA thioesterase
MPAMPDVIASVGKMNEKGEYVISLRVYFEDTDAGGIVYHASYLRFMERARTELLRSLGVSQHTFALSHQAWFAVRRMAIDYFQPSRLDDVVEVTASIEKIGGASIWLAQIVRRENTKLVSAKVQVACIDSKGNVCRLPYDLRQNLASSVSGTLQNR